MRTLLPRYHTVIYDMQPQCSVAKGQMSLFWCFSGGLYTRDLRSVRVPVVRRPSLWPGPVSVVTSSAVSPPPSGCFLVHSCFAPPSRSRLP
eukprot:scaffold10981_cov124-Isochrysis_galbana.AAC.1